MKIVTICLARINSKRLPGKLMIPFYDKPLIHYTAEIMQKLGYESYLYTDSKEMQDYIRNNFDKIIVKDKPNKYCQDKHITNIELEDYNKDIQADVFIYLAGTSPIRNINIIKNGIDCFIRHIDKYDCAMSVHKLPDRFYYMNSLPVNYYLNLRNFQNNKSNKEMVFEETGSLYVFKKELLKNNFFINDRCLFIDDMYNFDIDTETDFKKAENYYKEFLYENK